MGISWAKGTRDDVDTSEGVVVRRFCNDISRSSVYAFERAVADCDGSSLLNSGCDMFTIVTVVQSVGAPLLARGEGELGLMESLGWWCGNCSLPYSEDGH